MKVLAIIPARAGSKRLPGKNTRLLAGKPLIAHVIEAAIPAEKLSMIVVNSDDNAALAIARQYPRVIAMKRPAELATDTAPAIDYVRHTLEQLEEDFDAVVILQPTSPLTLPEDIDGTVDLLLSSGADSAVSVVALDHMVHPFKLKVMDGDRLLPFLEEEKGRMAAHELPQVFVRNCAVYASTISTMRSGVVIGPDCRGYVMPPERSIDINEGLDFTFAEFLMGKNRPAAKQPDVSLPGETRESDHP